jgi:MFS family permease
MTLTPQIFMVYLLVDLTDSKDPAMDMTIIALSAQAAGIITSIPAGKLSDKFGRKIFVYLNTAVFIFCYQLFVFLDKVWIYYVIGATYGAAQGTYFAVEFALGVDCLPTENTDEFGMEEKKEARSTGSNMGMWVIAQAIGQVSGLYICGPLLEAVGSTGFQLT